MSWSVLMSKRYRVKPINQIRAEIAIEKNKASWVVVDKNYEEIGSIAGANAFYGDSNG